MLFESDDTTKDETILDKDYRMAQSAYREHLEILAGQQKKAELEKKNDIN